MKNSFFHWGIELKQRGRLPGEDYTGNMPDKISFFMRISLVDLLERVSNIGERAKVGSSRICGYPHSVRQISPFL